MSAQIVYCLCEVPFKDTQCLCLYPGEISDIGLADKSPCGVGHHEAVSGMMGCMLVAGQGLKQGMGWLASDYHLTGRAIGNMSSQTTYLVSCQ